MPFIGEHACQMNAATQFESNSIRRVLKNKLGIIFGKRTSDGKLDNISFRYPTKDWDENAARKHCGANSGKFEPAIKEGKNE